MDDAGRVHVPALLGAASGRRDTSVRGGGEAARAAPVYALELLELDGSAYYLGRVDGRDVSTAVGFNREKTGRRSRMLATPNCRKKEHDRPDAI
jgi:hypothetical protein